MGIKGTTTLTVPTIKRSVPKNIFNEVTLTEGIILVSSRKDRFGKIPEEWRGKYNHIQGEFEEVWFNTNLRPHHLTQPANITTFPTATRKTWYKEGERHRLDGPAVEWSDDSKEWWVEGKRHRLDGPAVEWCDGKTQWWVDGMEMTQNADHPDMPNLMGDNFYLLCTNTNPAIQSKALANPNCPTAWKVAGEILKQNS